ncbi:MAG TPA: hypothetical protein VHS05_15995 [Pyrinomonadaceae bacterium]|jgi:hypothetical protein|nr:hypothetical protein [Pyrinomonadaceae bacterium]
MSENNANEVSGNDDDNIDLGSNIGQLKQGIYLAKCEIKTAIREIAINQKFTNDLFLKLRGDFNEINERLHGIELRQQRENSST